MGGRFTIEAIFKGIDRMSAPLANMTRGVDRMILSSTRAVTKFDNALGSMRSGIMATGGAFAGAGVLAGAGAASIIGAGADFEQAITSVGAVSLKTRDQIADLEKRALELGSSTQFSATQVAQAMELMGRAGFENADVLSGIEGVLSAAAAEGADLATTAGHVSNVLKGMGMATAETTRVADVLTLASAATNSSISSLGESMSKVSATARQFKIPFEDAVASVALLQDVGLDASEAGSAVDTMLTMLASPTDAISRKMRSLGVSFQDAKGDMLPLSSVLQNFATASQKSGGNMKQAAFFAELLGMRGQRAAVNLKDLFLSGKVDTLVQSLKGAEGSAAKMADLRMDNLIGDWEQFTGAIEGVKINLFNLESGPLRGVIQGWTEWISANEGLIVSGVQGFLTDLRRELPGLALDVKTLGGATLGFFRGVRENLPTIITATEWFGKAALGVYGVTFAMKAGRVVMVGWGAAVATTTYFTTAGTIGNNAYTASLGVMRVAAISAGHGLGVMRTALNATALASSINGVTSLLGKAGLLGAAFAVGYAIGSWLDHIFGFSDSIIKLMSKLTGLEERLGIRKTTREEAFKDYIPNTPTRPGYQHSASLFDMSADSEAQAAAVSPMVVSQEQRIARAISESTTTEKVEMTVHTDPGTTAEVTKQPSSGSRTRLKLPASGSPRG